MLIHTYILSYNCPSQFNEFVQRMWEEQKEFFQRSKVILCNQSDEDSFNSEYEKICNQYNIELWNVGKNLGCTGGRVNCAKHFANSDAEFMFYFEEDQSFNKKIEFNQERNPYGFPYYVENVCEKILNIMELEKLDYLKINFQEAATDHTVYWPKELAKDYFSKFTKMGYHQIGYLIGEVFYCNWASCISKEGNKKLFTDDHLNGGEYSIVKLSHELIDSGVVKAGVLMASPLLHRRIYDYDRSKRFDI